MILLNEDDRNVRHHRTRWAMAFYYPQDVSEKMGPTSVLPASQYYTSRDQAERNGETLLCGPAGTVTIVHYDLWHRATANNSDRNRFMLKFLFCRMTEPAAPSWNFCPARPRPTFNNAANPALCRSIWHWYLGQNEGEVGPTTGSGSVPAVSQAKVDRPAAASLGAGFEPNDGSLCWPESDRLEHVYMLSAAAARAALQNSLGDENLYVRGNARLALTRSAKE